MVNNELNINTIIKMLSSEEILQIIKEDASKPKIELGFNIFTLISDLYYRENFHRDIIFEFLNPNGSHKQGDKYLMLFLNMLGINHFQNAVVYKEYSIDDKRRIDTLITGNITGEKQKQAIIIENKMNNAGDMYRQLPDYFHYVQKIGYNVKCIVYLPLLYNKVPDESGWSKTEINSVRECLKIIPAFSNEGIKNLCDNWLIPSETETKDADCKLVLSQYVKLIKYLNINNMNYIILEKFYETIKVGENLKIASSISDMLNDLPAYMAARIRNKYMYNYSPFKNLCMYKDTDTLFDDFTLDDKNYYRLDIYCKVDGYDMIFWNTQNNQEKIKTSFADLTALKEFEQVKDPPYGISRHIGFYEEEKVFSTINLLCEELSALTPYHF